MRKLNEQGQTLIALLVFMLVAMTVTFGAIAIAITNIQSNNSFSSGEIALQNANNGIENTLINLERNPNYSGGTLNLSNGTATISVSGTTTYTIVSVGSSSNYKRTVTALANYSLNVLTVTKWSESP